MKKLIWTICLIMGFASAVYAASFCCGDGKTKDQCCAERGKIYCPSDETCRTRCPDVTPPDCIGGCINPEGVCCTWCPSIEVCKRMGKCQKIVDGCYDCVACPDPNPCTEGQCLNEEGVCCDSCPRVCPEGQCLMSVDGCYQCGECGRGDDDDDDDDDEPTETTSPESEPTEPTPTEPDDDDDDDEPTETDTVCAPPKCVNIDGECCNACPESCPTGECLVNIDGCYYCQPCCDESKCGACQKCNSETNKCENTCSASEECCNGECKGFCECFPEHQDCDKCKDVRCDAEQCLICDSETGNCISKCGEGQTCCKGACHKIDCGECQEWNPETCCCEKKAEVGRLLTA